MGIFSDIDQFNDLYSHEPSLTPQAHLEDLLDTAEKYQAYVMARVFCIKVYGHNDPRKIEASDHDDRFLRYIEYLGPVVTIAVCKARARSVS